jgi:hypothetical protein
MMLEGASGLCSHAGTPVCLAKDEKEVLLLAAAAAGCKSAA